jgi:hypothetical protein
MKYVFNLELARLAVHHGAREAMIPEGSGLQMLNKLTITLFPFSGINLSRTILSVSLFHWITTLQALGYICYTLIALSQETYYKIREYYSLDRKQCST